MCIRDSVATLAVVSIVVGNVGALGQSSLKRIMAWSSVAQAGYMLAGVVVGTRLGLEATVFYLATYLVLNMAVFATIAARERTEGLGDDIASIRGLGARSPLYAGAMTVGVLGLAGIPATAGFIGKFALINAAVEDGWAWLGVMIVIGSMISLAYYLRIVAAMWMPAEAGTALSTTTGRPALAGGDAAEVRKPGWEVALVALVFGLATVALGVVPEPLFDLASHAGNALQGLL